MTNQQDLRSRKSDVKTDSKGLRQGIHTPDFLIAQNGIFYVSLNIAKIMEIGPIKPNKPSQPKPLPPKPEPIPPTPQAKIYTLPMYCSLTQDGTKLLLKQGETLAPGGSQGEVHYIVIHKKKLSNATATSDSETVLPPGGTVRGDTDCLNCRNPLSVFCNQCERWYCGATIEEGKGVTFHTCPVHGRAQIVGTRNVEPNTDPKKK